MKTMKEFVGDSIIAAITFYCLLLIMFPLGWVVLLGITITDLSIYKRYYKRYIESRNLGADSKYL
ncbi:hypothetical protein [Methanosarcina sp. 2.H.A.1B.4]|uniref:hypothetical protein n=1 Tax=Methanosarcina sp. 2.H.A.1B.4 TaxID=1483600 RepID=UPI0012E0B1A6|nr:hypothetical protein [Methanosarcina sp. 2.H.A.1B.4]